MTRHAFEPALPIPCSTTRGVRTHLRERRRDAKTMCGSIAARNVQSVSLRFCRECQRLAAIYYPPEPPKKRGKRKPRRPLPLLDQDFD